MRRIATILFTQALLALMACPLEAAQKGGGGAPAQPGGGGAQPGNPGQPPGGSGQPGNPAQPPGGSQQPGNPAQPGGSQQPGNPAQPGGFQQPGNPAQPGGSQQPGNPAQPGGSQQPGNPAQPGGSQQPGNPAQPQPGQPMPKPGQQGNPGTQPPINPAQAQGGAPLPGSAGNTTGGLGNANAGINAQVNTAPGFAGNGVGKNPWFNQGNIQKNLNLTTEQMNQLNAAHGNAYKQYQSEYDKMKNLTPQQRAEQGSNLSGAYNNQLNDAAKSSMNPQQYQRYQEVQLQYQGLGAFNNPSVQQKLNLTPAQIQELRNYENAQGQRWADAYKATGYNQVNMKASYQSLVGQNENLIRQVLTPAQWQSWGQMVGAPYTFEPHWENNK